MNKKGLLGKLNETEAPFAIQIYELDQISIDLAHEQRNNLLDLYRSCIDNDNWHGYKEEILKLKTLKNGFFRDR